MTIPLAATIAADRGMVLALMATGTKLYFEWNPAAAAWECRALRLRLSLRCAAVPAVVQIEDDKGRWRDGDEWRVEYVSWTARSFRPTKDVDE